jgi:hypothetical protein
MQSPRCGSTLRETASRKLPAILAAARPGDPEVLRSRVERGVLPQQCLAIARGGIEAGRPRQAQGPRDAEPAARGEVALDVESVLDGGVNRQKRWADPDDLKRCILRSRRRASFVRRRASPSASPREGGLLLPHQHHPNGLQSWRTPGDPCQGTASHVEDGRWSTSLLQLTVWTCEVMLRQPARCNAPRKRAGLPRA